MAITIPQKSKTRTRFSMDEVAGFLGLAGKDALIAFVCKLEMLESWEELKLGDGDRKSGKEKKTIIKRSLDTNEVPEQHAWRARR